MYNSTDICITHIIALKNILNLNAVTLEKSRLIHIFIKFKDLKPMNTSKYRNQVKSSKL